MASFYTKQKTIVGDNGGPRGLSDSLEDLGDDPPYFDIEVNKLLYEIRDNLDIKITYNTIYSPTENGRPIIHIAYVTWKEQVLAGDDRKIKTKK